MQDDPCPCGQDRPYAECCGRVHASGAGLGVTAEQLMRARYCAYVRHDAAFLLASWHADTRPPGISFDDDLEWLGLDVERTEAGGALDSAGIVEFRARFRRGGELLELHETSRFERVDGSWVYIDGE